VTKSTSASEGSKKRSLLLQERSQETRRKLIRAATRLWAEDGYDTATVEEICAAAGVGRTTFYLHFESKKQLLGELTWATASGVAADVEASIGTGGLDEQLAAFIDGLVRRMESVPKSLAALVLQNAVGGAQPPAHSDRVLFENVLAGIFLQAQDQGEIRAEVDSNELGAILSGMTMEALHRWATSRSRSGTLRDNLQLRAELIVDGLRI
jgi:AcrR family transcriptional regulator